MNHFYYASLAFCLGAFAAHAQDIQIAGPYGSTILMDRMDCLDGITCVQADRFGAAPDASGSVLLLPEWTIPLLADGASSSAMSAYVQGISDSIVFDKCSYCNCCLISHDSNTGKFTPWSANQFDHLRNMSPFRAGQ